MQMALDLFRGPCNCAQAVLLAFTPEHGLDEKLIMEIAAGFGGGIARTGQVCGAVTGAVMALGIVCSRAMSDPNDKKELTIRVVQQFLEEFRLANGSLYCSELLDGLDLRLAQNRQTFKTSNLHQHVCEPAVRSAIEAADKLIQIVTSTDDYPESV